jgi:hypothetical protein
MRFLGALTSNIVTSRYIQASCSGLSVSRNGKRVPAVGLGERFLRKTVARGP